jgi:hypothetical protein
MRAPESILTEVTWRWAFGAAFWGLLIVSFHEYFSQIEISRAEYALMKSLEPFTWIAITYRVMQAFLEGARAIGPILFPALALLWLALATIGRAVTVRALAAELGRTNWLSLLELNGFRLAMTFAGFIAYFGAAILVSTSINPQQHYAANILIMLIVMIVLLVIWSVVNWFVGLGQIFAAANGDGFLDSLRSAGNLYQTHSGAFASSGVWFSVLRLGLLVVVTVGSISPVANVSVGGAKPFVVFVAIITLVYFAVADALNIWRLSVYIGLTEPAAVDPVPEPLASPPPAPFTDHEPERAELVPTNEVGDEGVPTEQSKPIADN